MSDMRNSWARDARRSTRPEVQGTSGFNFGSCFSTLVVLALLGAAGWGAWKYGPAILEKFRMTTDAENAASTVLHELPATFPSEASLKEQVGLKANEIFETHHAKKYRWYVVAGPGGVAPTVVRDDQFSDGEKTFFNGFAQTFTETDSPVGQKYDAKTRPLGAKWKTVKIDDRAWRIVVGWRDPAE